MSRIPSAGEPTADRGARWLRRGALAFAWLFVVVGSIFTAAEAMGDPGGPAGAGLVALWLVPLVGLAVLAWKRPERAATVLGLLTATVVVEQAVSYAFGSGRSFESGHGPVGAIAVLALMLPLALLGSQRPRAAGWMLVVLGLALIVAAASSGPGRLQGTNSSTAVAVPAILDGLLFLLSAAAAGHDEPLTGMPPSHLSTPAP